MKPEREMAIEAMQNLGWTAKRVGTGKQVTWNFTRPDTGGLWDLIKCKQANLSLTWVAQQAMNYGDADDLIADISAVREAWLKRRFYGIFKRADSLTTPSAPAPQSTQPPEAP